MILNPFEIVEVAGPVTLMFPLIPRVVPGDEVPIPTLPSPDPSMERIGSSEVVEVAKAKAFSWGWIVEVAVRLKVRVRSTAVDEPKLILRESKNESPLTDKYIDGVVVPIPNLPELVNLNLSVSTLALSKLSAKVPKAKSPSGVLDA